MHVFIINRRKIKKTIGRFLLVIILILGIVLLLNRTPYIATSLSNITNYNKYVDKDNKFSFEYPKGFTITPRNFEDNRDIVKHVDFDDVKSGLRGFVEVWNLKEPLKDFLETSRKHSVGNYKYYDINNISINGNDGYENLYSVLGNDDKYYKAKEVFFKKDNIMYRMSFFIEEDKCNSNVKNVIDNMIKKFKF